MLDVGECATDFQLSHRRMIEEVEHPHMGRFKVPGVVIKLSATPGAIRSAPPMLGQHNREVLGEMLGMPPRELEALSEQGII